MCVYYLLSRVAVVVSGVEFVWENGDALPSLHCTLHSSHPMVGASHFPGDASSSFVCVSMCTCRRMNFSVSSSQSIAAEL